MKTRGKIIKEARLRAEMTQSKVAEKVNMTQQQYSNIENDLTDQLRRSALKAIASVLNIDENQLFLKKPMPSRAAMDVAFEFDEVPPAYQTRILQILLEARRQSVG